MKKRMLFLCLLALHFAAHSQRLFTSPAFDFSIDTPVHWQRLDTGATVANFGNLTLDNEQLKNLMELHQGTIAIVVMAKRTIADADGIIPTVRINARHTTATSLGKLAFNLQETLPKSMTGFVGFKYELPFSTFTLNGTQGLKAIISYSLPHGDEQLHARTRLYMFLRNGYYIQISLSDSDREDESDLFNTMAESIRFN